MYVQGRGVGAGRASPKTASHQEKRAPRIEKRPSLRRKIVTHMEKKEEKDLPTKGPHEDYLLIIMGGGG